MTAITETITDPSEEPIEGVAVTIQVAGDGGRPLAAAYAADGTLVNRFRIETGENGVWSVDLPANENLTPAGTAYRIILTGKRVDSTPRYVTVPATAGPHDVADILTDAPGAIAPPALAAHQADTTDVHGIPDTSALLVIDDVGDTVQAHSADLDTLAAGGKPAALQAIDDGRYQPLAAPYSVVLIPDTQYLSEGAAWQAHWDAACDWIVANKTAENIQLVMHLGDLVDDGNTTQFNRMEGGLDDLYALGVPFLAAIGNHDYDGGTSGAPTRDSDLWNTYLGQDRYIGQTWWDGEFYDGSDSDTYVCRVTLGGRPTLIVCPEVYPRAAALAWCVDQIEAHPTHDVIVLTHAYLTLGSGVQEYGQDSTDAKYGADHSSGRDIWEAIRVFDNVIGVYNGHFFGSGIDPVMSRVDYTNTGAALQQHCTNWQNVDQGGDGRIVLLTVDPTTNQCKRRVYNARTDTFETTDGYEISYPWSSRVPQPSALIRVAEPWQQRPSLRLTGDNSNSVSVPDAATWTPTERLAIQALVTPDDWSPGSNNDQQAIIGQYDISSQRSWLFGIRRRDEIGAGGQQVFLNLSTDGTAVMSGNHLTPIPGVVNGEPMGIRALWQADPGDIQFFYLPAAYIDDFDDLDDLARWTRFGAVMTAGGTPSVAVPTSLHNSTADLRIGCIESGILPFSGLIHAVSVEIDGVTVASPRFDRPASPRMDDAQGNVWTFEGDEWHWHLPT